MDHVTELSSTFNIYSKYENLYCARADCSGSSSCSFLVESSLRTWLGNWWFYRKCSSRKKACSCYDTFSMEFSSSCVVLYLTGGFGSWVGQFSPCPAQLSHFPARHKPSLDLFLPSGRCSDSLKSRHFHLEYTMYLSPVYTEIVFSLHSLTNLLWN